jgi:S1-C subfamily serine protease
VAGVLIVGSGCGGGPSDQQQAIPESKTLADVVAEVRSGVVRIEAKTCDGTSIGTGFLIGRRQVATVEHVVEGARVIRLLQQGKVVATAVTIGSDKARDIALLRANRPVKGHVLEVAASAPRLGEEVAALGFPLGLPLTVTRGSVSGMNRTISIEGVKRQRLMQTDAAVNPGNSGGPLLRVKDGKVVGLIDLRRTEVNGIAFAVSASVAGPLLAAWQKSPQPEQLGRCSGPLGGQAATNGEDEAYVRAIDAALVDSAHTRGDLGGLINDVTNGLIPYAVANARIRAITEQRRSLLDAVSSVAAPPAFVEAAALLRRSINDSIEDDLAISNWIDAVYLAPEQADYYWQQQAALSAEASAAKTAFLNEYNRQRQRRLNLPSIDVRY